MKSEKQRRRLFNKLRPWGNGKQAYGYLTSVEALYLISIGCRIERTDRIEHYKECVAKGFAAPQWFYFYPTKEVISKINQNWLGS